MRLRKRLPAAVLLLTGLALAAANLWFTAARSTIPLSFNGRIARKVRLAEKTPGVDDVYLIHFAGGRSIQVDQGVFASLERGKQIRKRRWSKLLEQEGEQIELQWSADFRGMLWVMPATILVLVGTGLLAGRRVDRT